MSSVRIGPNGYKLCKRGHEKTPENSYYSQGGQYTACKTCIREYSRKRYVPKGGKRGRPKMVKVEVNCMSCGKVFEAYPKKLAKGKSKFCSRNCASRHNMKTRESHPCQGKVDLTAKRHRIRVCPECGKEFKRQGGNNFCSRSCSFTHQKREADEYASTKAAKTKARDKEYGYKRRGLLADSYLAAQLGLKTKDAVADLLEIKRLTIKLQREIKQCQT